MSVIACEQPVGVVVAFGGQTAVKLAKCLDSHGVRILGTSAEGIDLAEDRERFDGMLGRLGIRRPAGRGVLSEEEAVSAAAEIGYPVLVRPSYVIGGQNMTIAYDEGEVRAYMRMILRGGADDPVLVDKYMPGTETWRWTSSPTARDVLIPGIMEHIERAGVHSAIPSPSIRPTTSTTPCAPNWSPVRKSWRWRWARGGWSTSSTSFTRGGSTSSRSIPAPRAPIPYISKVTGIPMVDIASRVMLGAKLRDLGCGTGLQRTPPYFAVKVPVFSFEKLTDANAYLSPEMKSTGEVLGLGKRMEEALFKGLTAAGIRVPQAGQPLSVLLSVDDHDHYDLVTLAKKLFDLKAKDVRHAHHGAGHPASGHRRDRNSGHRHERRGL